MTPMAAAPTGAENGLYPKLCRCTYPLLDYFGRGILRTLQLGTAWTRSRQNAAGKIGLDQCGCVLCGRERDTLGHRFWRCPGVRRIFPTALLDFNPNEHPLCLTRCGLVPLAYKSWKEQFINALHIYMVDVMRLHAEASQSQGSPVPLSLAVADTQL